MDQQRKILVEGWLRTHIKINASAVVVKKLFADLNNREIV